MLKICMCYMKKKKGRKRNILINGYNKKNMNMKNEKSRK